MLKQANIRFMCYSESEYSVSLLLAQLAVQLAGQPGPTVGVLLCCLTDLCKFSGASL